MNVDFGCWAEARVQLYARAIADPPVCQIRMIGFSVVMTDHVFAWRSLSDRGPVNVRAILVAHRGKIRLTHYSAPNTIYFL